MRSGDRSATRRWESLASAETVDPAGIARPATGMSPNPPDLDTSSFDGDPFLDPSPFPPPLRHCMRQQAADPPTLLDALSGRCWAGSGQALLPVGRYQGPSAIGASTPRPEAEGSPRPAADSPTAAASSPGSEPKANDPNSLRN